MDRARTSGSSSSSGCSTTRSYSPEGGTASRRHVAGAEEEEAHADVRLHRGVRRALGRTLDRLAADPHRPPRLPRPDRNCGWTTSSAKKQHLVQRLVTKLITATGKTQRERRGQLRHPPPRRPDQPAAKGAAPRRTGQVRRRADHLARHQAVPRHPDAMYPVPRPPVQQGVAAGRLLGRQRVLPPDRPQRHADRGADERQRQGWPRRHDRPDATTDGPEQPSRLVLYERRDGQRMASFPVMLKDLAQAPRTARSSRRKMLGRQRRRQDPPAACSPSGSSPHDNFAQGLRQPDVGPPLRPRAEQGAAVDDFSSNNEIVHPELLDYLGRGVREVQLRPQAAPGVDLHQRRLPAQPRRRKEYARPGQVRPVLRPDAAEGDVAGGAVRVAADRHPRPSPTSDEDATRR